MDNGIRYIVFVGIVIVLIQLVTIGVVFMQQRTMLDAATRADQSRQELSKLAQELGAKVEAQLVAMRQGNEAKLELMRQTVDEKLQGTLDRRLGESFKLVADQLESVQKGLGEMQTLATGVGDLKKVLSNVKTRGIFGEVQLRARMPMQDRWNIFRAAT